MLYATAEVNVHGNKRKYTEDQGLYSPPFLWDMQSTENNPRNRVNAYGTQDNKLSVSVVQVEQKIGTENATSQKTVLRAGEGCFDYV